MTTLAAVLVGVGLRHSRPRRCDAEHVVHVGPVSSTSIPSIGRCLSCGSVFGHDD